jgi:hypothetical protein
MFLHEIQGCAESTRGFLNAWVHFPSFVVTNRKGRQPAKIFIFPGDLPGTCPGNQHLALLKPCFAPGCILEIAFDL